MTVERSGTRCIVASASIRATIDSSQGGNITLAEHLPRGIPVLTTNYHSTDAYILIDGIGGFYSTGDPDAAMDVLEQSSDRVVVETRASLVARPGNPVEPSRVGTAVRRYTFWDDLPVIRFDTEMDVDPRLAGPGWRSSDARLVDMESSFDELDRFAWPAHDGTVVSGPLEAAMNGTTRSLGEPWYCLSGRRLSLTVRLDDPAKYCFYWAENALINMGALGIRGVAFLAQWSYGERRVGPADAPLRGTFWVGFGEGPGPTAFPCR